MDISAINRALAGLKLSQKIPTTGISNCFTHSTTQQTAYNYITVSEQQSLIELQLISIIYNRQDQTSKVYKNSLVFQTYFKHHSTAVTSVHIAVQSSPDSHGHLVEVTLDYELKQKSKKFLAIIDFRLEQVRLEKGLSIAAVKLRRNFKCSQWIPCFPQLFIVLTDEEILLFDCQDIFSEKSAKRIKDFDFGQQIISLSLWNGKDCSRYYISLLGRSGTIYVLALLLPTHKNEPEFVQLMNRFKEHSNQLLQKVQEELQSSSQEIVLIRCFDIKEQESRVWEQLHMVTAQYNSNSIQLAIKLGSTMSSNKKQDTLQISVLTYQGGKAQYHQTIAIIILGEQHSGKDTGTFQLLQNVVLSGQLFYFHNNKLYKIDLSKHLNYFQTLGKTKTTTVYCPEEASNQLIVDFSREKVNFIIKDRSGLKFLRKGATAIQFHDYSQETLEILISQLTVTQKMVVMVRKVEDELKSKRYDTQILSKIKILPELPLQSQQSQLLSFTQNLSSLSESNIQKLKEQLSILNNKAREIKRQQQQFQRTFQKKNQIKQLLWQIERNEVQLQRRLKGEQISGESPNAAQVEYIASMRQHITERQLNIDQDARTEYMAATEAQLLKAKEITKKYVNIESNVRMQ